MSRNLGDTTCEICGSKEVVLCGTPHDITPEEAGPYFTEYQSMRVADAACKRCDAKYLAWLEYPRWARGMDDDRPFVDLSFRHAFNDEPDPEDLPTSDMLRLVHAERCARDLAVLAEKMQALAKEGQEVLTLALTGTSPWESYRR